MLFNPHKLGMHKVLKHIPLGAVFNAPYKAALKKAVNIADLRLIAKSRAHKVRRVIDHMVWLVSLLSTRHLTARIRHLSSLPLV